MKTLQERIPRLRQILFRLINQSNVTINDAVGELEQAYEDTRTEGEATTRQDVMTEFRNWLEPKHIPPSFLADLDYLWDEFRKELKKRKERGG